MQLNLLKLYYQNMHKELIAFIIYFLNLPCLNHLYFNPSYPTLCALILISLIIFCEYYFKKFPSVQFAGINFKKRNIFRQLSTSYFLPIISIQDKKKPAPFEISEARIYESFFNSSPIGFIRTDSKGKILYCNQAVLNILGFLSQNELLNFNYFKNPFRIKNTIESFFKNLENEPQFIHEEEWLKQSGNHIFIKENIKSIINEDGRLLFFDISIENITERFRLERSLEITEEKYKTILDQLPIGIYRIISTGEIVFSNLCFAKLLGFSSKQELIGKNISEFLSNPQEYESILKEKSDQHLSIFISEFVLNKQDKNKIWVQNTSNIFYDTSDEILYLDGVIEDITERKKSENDLKKLVTAINHISEGILVTDFDGNILFVNPAYEKMTLFQINELIGTNLRFLNNNPLFNELNEKAWSTMLSDKTWSGMMFDKKKNGENIEVLTIITPIKDNDGNIINRVVVKHDVTEERKLEQNLRHSQKLQAIGTLAGGIAHDFNNIIMGMQIYTEILLKKIPENKNEYGLLQKIYSAQNRAKDLIKQILSFSRQTDDERKPLQIHLIIKEALKLIKTTFPVSIKLVDKIKDCGYALANPAQIEQILINLCTNANYAVNGHGTISVELKSSKYIKYPDGKIIKNKYSWILLKVKDTGCGIEQKIRDRIFEPFFTTKSVGQGTGLGLSTVHGIVKQYGGEIFFDSEIGKGTVFYIYLPAVE